MHFGFESVVGVSTLIMGFEWKLYLTMGVVKI
jgi:hypothetical protein